MSAARLAPFASALRALAATAAVEASDRDLLMRYARQRDEAAFAALVRRHGRLVWNACRRVLPHHDAEDAFQATFLVLAKKAAALPADVCVAGWLHGAASRGALEVRRKAARRRRRESRAPLASASPPAGDLAWRELQTILGEELQRLPERFRTPFVLCCLEGQSKAEAARSLGCPEGTVSGRLAQARQTLRGRLARRGVTLSAVLCGLAVAPGEALPAGLLDATARAALGASAELASLAEDVARALFPRRPPLLAGLLLAVGVVCAGATLLSPSAGEARQEPTPPADVKDAPRLDRHGDALPPGAVARLGTVRLRHGFITYAVAFSPDGKTLATGGGGRGLCLWDAATGKELRVLVPVQHVYAVAFSPDGRRVASAYEIKKVRVWDVASGREVAELPGSEGGVPQALAFSPDGRTLACGGYDGLVRLLDVDAGTETRALKGHTKGVKALAFAPDGKTLASGSLDGTVRLWDAATGGQRGSLGGPGDNVLQVAFAPDGKSLASAGEKEGVRLWDLTTLRETRVLEAKDASGSVFALAPDGKSLATGHTDGTIRVWDVATGREGRRWPASTSRVNAVAFSPDGKRLASGGSLDSAVRLWDAATGRDLLPPGGPHAYITRLAFGRDGKSVRVGARDRVLRRWDWAEDKETVEAVWPSAPGWLQQFAPDGKTFATMKYQDNEVLLWGENAREPLRLKGHEEGVKTVAFAADGKALASGDGKGTVRLWDVASGRERSRFVAGPEIGALAFSPDGKTLAACAHIGTPPGPYVPAVRLWDLAANKEIRTFEVGDEVDLLVFSPDGRRLAVSRGWRAPGFRLWDTRTGKPVPVPPGAEPCNALAFSPDGRWVAWGSGDRESVIRVCEVATGREALRLSGGHHTGVVGLSFAPDGRLLASAGGDSTVLVWDLCGRYRDGRLAPAKRAPRELDGLWTDLADADAARAWRAVQALAATEPGQVVSFLKDRLRPEPVADARRVAAWVADLDSGEFEAREGAGRRLEAQGLAAASALREALAATPSPEARRRLRDLLDRLEPARSPSLLRVLRALSVLEAVGVPAAREVIAGLSRRGAGGWLGEEAKGSLERLALVP